jgi:hypothetical protein
VANCEKLGSESTRQIKKFMVAAHRTDLKIKLKSKNWERTSSSFSFMKTNGSLKGL